MNDEDLKKSDYEEDNYFKCSQFFFMTKIFILFIGVIYFIGCMVKIIIS